MVEDPTKMSIDESLTTTSNTAGTGKADVVGSRSFKPVEVKCKYCNHCIVNHATTSLLQCCMS